MTLHVNGTGGNVEVRATDAANPTAGDGARVRAVRTGHGASRSTPPTETQSLVLWFTQLPDGTRRRLPARAHRDRPVRRRRGLRNRSGLRSVDPSAPPDRLRHAEPQGQSRDRAVHHRPRPRHRRLRSGRLHRRDLRRPRRPGAPGHRRLGHRRWRADEHHRGGELPRLPRRHPGPRAHGEPAEAGREVRRRGAVGRRDLARPRPATSRPSTTGGGETFQRARRHPGHRLRVPRARPGRREAPVRPRRLLVRHVRRVLLPRPGHRRGRRRRLRRRGGHVPHPVRQARHDGAPPRPAARLQDHGRPRRERPEDRVRVEQRGRRASTARTRSPA